MVTTYTTKKAPATEGGDSFRKGGVLYIEKKVQLYALFSIYTYNRE